MKFADPITIALTPIADTGLSHSTIEKSLRLQMMVMNKIEEVVRKDGKAGQDNQAAKEETEVSCWLELFAEQRLAGRPTGAEWHLSSF